MAVLDAAVSQSTQDSTQSTQQASQSSQYKSFLIDGDIWGSLIPLNTNSGATRVDFLKSKRKYTIGRSRANDVSFPKALRMSQQHCSIEWDGQETSASAIVVRDESSLNGTFIKGRRIDKAGHRLLHDWNIISFGPSLEDPSSHHYDPRNDYRFCFRHMASNQRPRQGVYAYYDIKSVIGSGAFAKVVKALHHVEGEFYAIKMFQGHKLRQMLPGTSPRGIEIDKTRDHLKREFEILQRLRHPNICQLKEAFFEDLDVSIVLELAKGGDLMKYVLQRDVLMEPEAQNFTYQICDALAYVHKHGIVHRDLKPENVLLTDDHPPIVKVADFGLANIMDSLSRLQTKCGTPAYVAPEVIDSNDGYDQLVDSWSLGVMIFMMLTQQTPFDDGTRAPHCALLHEYNISTEGEDFIRSLLRHDPLLRMTPAQGLHHTWLAVQRARAKSAAAAERASTRNSATSTLRASETPPPPNPNPNPTAPEAGPSRPAGDAPRASVAGAAKRKATDIARSMSSLSVDDSTKQRPPKKTKTRFGPRGADADADAEETEFAFAVPHAPASSAAHVPIPRFATYDTEPDEIPGLGLILDPPS